MSTKLTIMLALAAGFIGGSASQLLQVPVLAQKGTTVPQEILAHRFVLVDESGVPHGIFGFDQDHRPNLELRDDKGNTWSFTQIPRRHAELLPEK